MKFLQVIKRHSKNYFLSGVLVIIPVVITILVIRAIFTFLDELLLPFQRKLSPSSFVQELNKLIQKLQIPPKLLNAENENKENDIKALTTFLSSVEEVFSLIETEQGRPDIADMFEIEKVTGRHLLYYRIYKVCVIIKYRIWRKLTKSFMNYWGLY